MNAEQKRELDEAIVAVRNSLAGLSDVFARLYVQGEDMEAVDAISETMEAIGTALDALAARTTIDTTEER